MTARKIPLLAILCTANNINIGRTTANEKKNWSFYKGKAKLKENILTFFIVASFLLVFRLRQNEFTAFNIAAIVTEIREKQRKYGVHFDRFVCVCVCARILCAIFANKIGRLFGFKFALPCNWWKKTKNWQSQFETRQECGWAASVRSFNHGKGDVFVEPIQTVLILIQWENILFQTFTIKKHHFYQSYFH